MSFKAFKEFTFGFHFENHETPKAWFPVVLRIVRIGDSYNFPILGFLRLLRFLGQPIHTHRKNRRRLGCLGQYLQSRNDSDSSDHIVKIAARLGFLG